MRYTEVGTGGPGRAKVLSQGGPNYINTILSRSMVHK